MKKFLIVDDSPNWVRHHTNYVNYLYEDVEIIQAYSAKEADRIVSENIDEPFDVIFTDMQMETDFLPLNAGEWLIKQIQFYPEYQNSLIVIISASPIIEKLAKNYGVKFIPKRCCQDIKKYSEVLECKL